MDYIILPHVVLLMFILAFLSRELIACVSTRLEKVSEMQSFKKV